jgi:uncharacterized membrane protein HdeD (DUF308 family)
VFLIGGFYLLTHPLLAIGTFTVLLAAVIFAEGVFDIITYRCSVSIHQDGCC